MLYVALESVVRQAVCVLQHSGDPSHDARLEHLALRHGTQAKLLQGTQRIFANGVVRRLPPDDGNQQRDDIRKL